MTDTLPPPAPPEWASPEAPVSSTKPSWLRRRRVPVIIVGVVLALAGITFVSNSGTGSGVVGSTSDSTTGTLTDFKVWAGKHASEMNRVGSLLTDAYTDTSNGRASSASTKLGQAATIMDSIESTVPVGSDAGNATHDMAVTCSSALHDSAAALHSGSDSRIEAATSEIEDCTSAMHTATITIEAAVS